MTKASVALVEETDWLAQGLQPLASCAVGLRTVVFEVEFTAAGLSVGSPDVYDPGPNCPPWKDTPDALKRAIIRRIQGDAAAVVGWPSPAIASLRPAKGERTEVLEAPVASMVALELRDRPTLVTSNVRFAHVRPEPWGDALVFDVSVVATSHSPSGCPHRTSEARASGELVVSASDGKIVALHLKGPYEDVETACRKAPDTDSDIVSRQCARGVLSVDIMWTPCFTPA